MNYAAIHGGGRVSMNFPGFSPKVNYIIKKPQFIFLAKAFNGEGYIPNPRHKWHGKSMKSSCISTQSIYPGVKVTQTSPTPSRL